MNILDMLLFFLTLFTYSLVFWATKKLKLSNGITSPGPYGVCQASCPISYAANTTFLSNSLLSFDGFSQTSLTGFQLRTERFFQRSGLASLAVS